PPRWCAARCGTMRCAGAPAATSSPSSTRTAPSATTPSRSPPPPASCCCSATGTPSTASARPISAAACCDARLSSRPSMLRRIMSSAPVKLAVGEDAPAFDLPTAGGGRVDLASLRGAPVLLWFYPAANTSLCTKQACDLRDNHQMFLDAGYRVVGVSPDPVAELARFVAEQDLPYTLASDESHEVMTTYGAWGEKNIYEKNVPRTTRSTFAIDAEGVLTLVKYRVGTPKHIALLQEKLAL